MNAHNGWQVPNNTNNEFDKLSITLNESQVALKWLRRSAKESEAFNKKAREFLANSKKFISQSLTNSEMSIADTISAVPEEAPEKK